MINVLSKVVPFDMKLQEQRIEDDIATLVDDIESLELLAEACRDDYPEWHDTASSAIEASEYGTQRDPLETIEDPLTQSLSSQYSIIRKAVPTISDKFENEEGV